MDKLDQLLADEDLTRFEGRKGVENLAIVCNKLGYQDTQYMGQFSHRASLGDIIEFLEDNSGAIEALLNFIRDNQDSYNLEEPEEEDDE